MDNSFLRTPQGLNNEASFFDVDYVVYLEGGTNSYTIDQVIDEGKYNEETDDIIFWRNLFKHFCGSKIKYKSVGSKITLLDLHKRILDETKNILICMDSDFDKLSNNCLEDKRVFYTYGYSWENDVFCLDVIKKVCCCLTALDQTSVSIENRFTSFLQEILDGVKADYLLSKNACSFFSRDGGRLKYVDSNAKVKTSLLKEDIERHGITTKQLLDTKIYDAQRYCFGHLLADYSCRLITVFLKEKLDSLHISNNLLNRAALNQFYYQLESDLIKNPIYHYYKTQFERLGA